jgi:serine protease Do
VAGARRVQVLVPLSLQERAQQGSILEPPGTMMGGQVIGIDVETDLAVVKVPAKDLTPLALGDSDALAAGQIVLAFGSPLGLSNSVTLGVVSSVARQLAPEHPVVYIQTDAPINPGNSGGPLVDVAGRVVGINTMILSQSGGSEGIGFAVPSNIVRNVYQQIRTTGRVRRGHIGVHAQTIDPVLARALGLARDAGVILGDVYPGSPADQAGLRAGDIVLALDGKPMENGRQFDVNLYRRAASTEVTIEYLRGERRLSARVDVAERPDNPERFADMVTPEQNLVPRLGILGVDLTQQIASLLPGLRVREGVVVAAQSPEGPAWRDSFQPGDVIVGFNGARVGDLEALKAAVAGARTGDAVAVQVQRGPRMQYLWFEME